MLKKKILFEKLRNRFKILTFVNKFNDFSPKQIQSNLHRKSKDFKDDEPVR